MFDRNFHNKLTNTKKVFWMNLWNKNILILGLAISGVSTAKALNRLGVNITINDMKTAEELSTYINDLSDIRIDYQLGKNIIDIDSFDYIIKSPGIPLNVPIIEKAVEMGIEVITDIELAYRLAENPFVAITGTNGKTTTTTLLGRIFKNFGNNCHVTGNIGVGILWELVNSTKEDVFVIETSSFQLESTKYFKPKVSLIINITPDHLNWHKSMDNYIKAKAKIFANQDENDYTILNYDDPIVREFNKEAKSNIIYFSVNNKLDKGIYIDEEYIVINDGEKTERIMPYKEVRIPGKHSLENALGALGVGWVMGVDINIIIDTLKEFEGVEHRLEYVDTIDGMKFYNDSKGTNPDASIKAVEALESPILLIAGGMDKGSDFEDFIGSFNNKVKSLILLGETAKKIKDTAISQGFNNIYIVETMKEAVLIAYEIGEKGDNILLSPACASWDMYKDFEERGRDFKMAVKSIREA